MQYLPLFLKKDLCPKCRSKRKKIKSKLSLYKSHEERKKKKTCSCGCACVKPQPIKNQYLKGKMLDRNKCSFYQKTSGKHHKLCLGQSKTSRRKVNNGLETNLNHNENCVNTTNSLLDPTLIFPLEEEETPKFSGNRFHETVSISSAQLDSKSILSTLPNKKHFLSTNIRQSVKIVCRQSSETGSNKQENTIDPPEKKNVK